MEDGKSYAKGRRPWLCEHHYFCITTAVDRKFFGYEEAMSYFFFISVQCRECIGVNNG